MSNLNVCNMRTIWTLKHTPILLKHRQHRLFFARIEWRNSTWWFFFFSPFNWWPEASKRGRKKHSPYWSLFQTFAVTSDVWKSTGQSQNKAEGVKQHKYTWKVDIPVLQIRFYRLSDCFSLFSWLPPTPPPREKRWHASEIKNEDDRVQPDQKKKWIPELKTSGQPDRKCVTQNERSLIWLFSPFMRQLC